MKHKIFWCKINKYFTDKWLESEYLKDKKWIFIATCVVTDKAKRKWIKFVKNTAKELKDWEKIFISWCGDINKWEIQKDFYKLYEELETFKDKIELLKEESDVPARNNLWIISANLYTKKFLLIQNWCDSFCSFCLTVLKRWRHFSKDKDEIVNEILEFEKIGWKEVVLTGVNLWAWWAKNTNNVKSSKFSELLEYILKNTKILRIRISSLWPEFVDEKCLEIFKNTRIYPHFHYSVQSGSTKILKSMKRHYDGKYIRNLLEKTKNLKRDDKIEVSVWADLIVGFPKETKKDFLETYKLVKDGLITKCHIFPFSNHKIWETVPASNLPNQIDEKTKKERVKKLERIWEKIRNNFIKRNIWKEFNVLTEFVKNNNWKLRWKGWTENYIEANEKNFEIKTGEIRRNNIIKWKLLS